LGLASFLLISILNVAFVAQGFANSLENEIQDEQPNLMINESSYTGTVPKDLWILREPIRIDTDEEFSKRAQEEDWPGDGTEKNPYVISRFSINGENDGYCIFIGNTTVHFEVRNNLLRNAQGGVGTYFRNAGIHLYNVDNGTLYDNTINNNFFGIYLEGSHSTNTVLYNNIDICYSGLILDGSDRNDLLNNEISNYTIHGISLTNYSFGNNIIENVIQDGGNFGVHLIGESRANYLQRNIIMDNSVAGIYVFEGSTGTDLWVNTLENNEDYGIYLDADNSDLRTNEITRSNIGINIESRSNLVLRSNINDVSSRGIRISGDENTIEDSTIDSVTDGISYGILVHEEGAGNVIIDNTISNTNHFAIGVLGDSIDNEIKDNHIFECNHGIVFGNVQILGGNTATGNVIEDINVEGIRIFASTETEILNNELSNGQIGIYIRGDGCGPNNIEGNDISDFTDSGIKIDISDQDIKDNTIYENFNSIILDGGVNNQISENTIYDNINRGILLQDDSTDNHIDSNEILSNWQGIVFSSVHGNTITNNLIKGSLSEGIRQAGSDNLIFGNDFIDNEVHAWDDNPNNWDDSDPNDGGSGGNYWDDDHNLDRGDGIGEDPYIDIEGGAGAQDRYPWVEAQNVEAEFILYDWYIDPDTVFIDEVVVIEGRVENIGHQTNVTNIDLYIGDMVSHIEREEVELAPGEVDWVTFEGEPGEEWDIEEPGIYDVKVEPYHWPDNAWENELEIIGPEEFVLNDWSISPNPAYMFETVTIQGEVENIGGVEGFTEVIFYIDGTTIYGQDVELPSGETEWVIFEGVPFDDWDIDKSGVYDIKIEIEYYPDEYWESELITHVFTDGEGTEEDPYLIEDWYHLEAVSYLMDAHFLLVNDLDENSAGYDELVGTAKGWKPIGSTGNEYEFKGNFDGGEHEIHDLFIDRDSYAGLFGVVGDGGQVANLGVIDLDVSGFELVSGLVGWNNDGTISNSYVTGKVTGEWAVGGLVGLSQEDATISNSYAVVEVTGTDEKIGGLVGYNRGLISDSYASGEVNGEIRVGGLVGDNWRGNIEKSFATNDVTGIAGIGGLVGLTDDATISTSYATGDVTGEEGIGGFVGVNWGTIENSYSLGDIYRVSSSDDVDFGGFVGINNMGRIINCYSTGQVIYEDAEDPTDKGFAGDINTGGNYEMSNNFWDVEISGQDSTAGEATGKTTAEMKDVATFTDLSTEGLDEAWDFVQDPYDDEGKQDIWNIDDYEVINDGYPFFARGFVELILNVEGEGSIHRVPEQGVYEKGSEVDLTAIADEGWYFVEWTSDYENMEETITIEMDEDKTITAVFEEETMIEFEVTDFEVNPLEAETGDEISITAVIKNIGNAEGTIELIIEGDVIESWTLGVGESVIVDETHTFDEEGVYDIVLGENVKTVAIGDVDTYTLEVNIVGEGTVAINPERDRYAEEETVTLTAEPEDGWGFSNWTGDVTETDAEITVTMDENKNITAHFVKIGEDMFSLTIDTEGKGSTEPSVGTYAYNKGEEVNVIATPDEGYYFVNWTGDYESEEKEIKISMDRDIEIKAHFEEGEVIFDIEITDFDENIKEGEEVTVKYRVKNIGEVKGTLDIVFDVNGDALVVYDNLTLDLDDEYDGEFTWKPDGAGDYSIGVFGTDLDDFVLVTVVEEILDDEDGVGFLSDYWWILPIIIIAAVVVLVLVMKMGKKGESTQPMPGEQEHQPSYEEPPQEQPPEPKESMEEMKSEEFDEEFEEEF